MVPHHRISCKHSRQCSTLKKPNLQEGSSKGKNVLYKTPFTLLTSPSPYPFSSQQQQHWNEELQRAQHWRPAGDGTNLQGT